MYKQAKTSVFFIVLTIIFAIAFAQTDSIVAAPRSQILPIATSWDYPMQNFHVQENMKWGTTVENTNYDVRNLDLILGGSDKITCFDVGSHRTFHAGVDLYPASLSGTNRSVRAIAAGQVIYRANGDFFPGDAIIIKHRLLDNSYVYSVYMHLQHGTVQVSENQLVTKGQLIGLLHHPNDHEGRFPEFHPDGDDVHLHFEIRTFQDAVSSGQFPQACDVVGEPGVGYTYPDRPNNYGYLDPLGFIEDRKPPPTLTQNVYLPIIVSSKQTCQEGKDLLLPPPYYRNPGFEAPNSYSAPWHEISNFIYYPGYPQTYPFVQGTFALSGNQSALLNSWGTPGCCGWSLIDEELVQSVSVPEGVSWVEWQQLVQLRNIDPGDQLIITLKDARTGHILATAQIIDETSGYPANVIYQITYQVTGSVAGRDLSISYSSISDNDIYETNFRIDDVSFVTHCSGTAQKTTSETIQVSRQVLPLR